jgi:hypothetical protein
MLCCLDFDFFHTTFIHYKHISFVESKVGGWVSGLRSPEDVELEVEEAEDISRNRRISSRTPSTPSSMTNSQTQTKT